jgi:hypothetical protein
LKKKSLNITYQRLRESQNILSATDDQLNIEKRSVRPFNRTLAEFQNIASSVNLSSQYGADYLIDQEQIGYYPQIRRIEGEKKAIYLKQAPIPKV